ncbi:MvaI/BcnI family restriction endonuclease [Enterococcus innesii]
MIFEPNSNELYNINEIHKFNESEYVLIRLTETMIKKNNIDANALLRDLLKSSDVVDYSSLKNGGKNGIRPEVELVLNETSEKIIMNFYKVKGKRSDPRFSIYGIKRMFEQGKLNTGDLLYVTVVKLHKEPKIVILNLTSNMASRTNLLSVFGIDEIEEALNRLIPEIRKISKAGFHKNSKGKGQVSPKDVGDTLEYLLGIKVNNSQKADFEGKIEIKAKSGKTMDILFTLRPRFEGTSIEKKEKIDRFRVSAFTRLYGYESEKHKGYKTLYITIGVKEAPQNKIGFFLEINEENRQIELRKWIDKDLHELTAFWTFDTLKKELHLKHPATLWVNAEQQVVNDTVEFNYFEAELSREPQFTTFLALVKTGGITYDWRGYTTPEGKYKGKNHGNAWRIKKKYRKLLFGSMEKIELV